MNLTPSSGKALRGLAVGSLALAISGAATIPASFAAPTAQPSATSSTAAPGTKAQTGDKPTTATQSSTEPTVTAQPSAESTVSAQPTPTQSSIEPTVTAQPTPTQASNQPSLPSTTTPAKGRVIDVSATTAQITQGLPGQFQVAYSAKNHKIWMVGVGDRGDLASTIARVNADTLQIEEVAALPIDMDENGVLSYVSSYGITVDDENGTVWVTNTTDNSLSVFDQETMEQIWTSHGMTQSNPNWIEHPRSVLVDQESGKAFVTGRFYVSAIDMETFEVSKIQLQGAPDGGTRYIGMNMAIDGDKLYVPERTSGKLFVVNTKTFKTERVIQTQGEDSSVEVRPSDVTVDRSQKEIYVSSQGVKGVNSGISVYDLETGAFKKFVKFGGQALSMVNDEDRDLVYVSDFATGKVAVFDAKTGRVIGEVEMNGAKANDLTLTADGSVVAVDKQDIEGVTATVPYVLDAKTGVGSLTDTYTTKASVDSNGKAVPSNQEKLKPNSIMKFNVEVADGEFTSPASITPSKLAFQGYPKTATATLVGPALDFAEGTIDISRPYTFHVSGFDFDEPPAEGVRLFLVKEDEWQLGNDELTSEELQNIQKLSTIIPASAFRLNKQTGKYSFTGDLQIPANTMQYGQTYQLGTVTVGPDVATNRDFDAAVSLSVNDVPGDGGGTDKREKHPNTSSSDQLTTPEENTGGSSVSKPGASTEHKVSVTKTPVKRSSSSSAVSSNSAPKSSAAQESASATKSSTQSGSLAKTGAQGVLSLAALGAFAMIAGAVLMVLRRRKA